MHAVSGDRDARAVESFDHLHHFVSSNYSLSELSCAADDPVRGWLSYRGFGELGLGDSRLIDARPLVRRGPGEIRKDPRDGFQILLVNRGYAGVSQNDRECMLRPGDIAVWHQARPFKLEFGENPSAIAVHIPYPAMIARIPEAERLVARRLRNNSKMGGLAESIIGQLMKLDASVEFLAASLSAYATDIIAATLQRELLGVTDVSPAQTDLLSQIKRYILANLDDADLNVARIAKANNISPRTLNRLFVAENSAPIRWLWRQRLAASYRALAEGKLDRITDVAFSYGFNDCSHFSRAFKKAFGRSPHTVKPREMLARTDSGSDDVARSSGIVDRHGHDRLI